MNRSLTLAASALFALSGTAFAQTGLSPIAQTIYDAVEKAYPAGSLCGDDSKLEDAVRDTTKALISQGVLSGRPRSEAQEAGAYIKKSCS
jgi:hypothetical protein